MILVQRTGSIDPFYTGVEAASLAELRRLREVSHVAIYRGDTQIAWLHLDVASERVELFAGQRVETGEPLTLRYK